MVAPDARETPHKYIQVQQFRTLNSQPSRTALEQDEFSWIENLMPIGDAYAPIVPGPVAFASLDAPTGVMISVSSPGVEEWVGTTASVGYTEPSVAGQFFGPYVGINEIHSVDSINSNIIWSELGFYNGASRIDTAGVSYVNPESADFGAVENLNDGLFSDASLYGKISTLASYLNKQFVVGYGFSSGPPVITAVRVGNTSLVGNAPANAEVVQSVDGTYFAYVSGPLTVGPPASGNTFGATITFSTLAQPGAQRYWRVGDWYTFFYPSAATRNLALSSLAIYDGIVDRTSQATATTTVTFVQGTLADLFDGNDTSGMEMSGTSLGNIDFDFGGTPRQINAVRLGIRDPFANVEKWAYQFSLYYSGDALTWTFAGKGSRNPYPGTATLMPIFKLY